MAHNSLDSEFCKKCGANLPADDVKLAKDRLEAAVADGFRIFNSGRTDEAMQIAETTVRANPSSTTALSLKAMCHERLGQISEALECHERVLELDPDSMIDKIKVNDLRNLLVARSSIAAVPDRRMAIIGAVAAFVLVASIGVVIAKSGNHADDKVAMNSVATDQSLSPKGSRFDSPVSPPGTQTQPNTGNPQQPNGNTGDAGSVRNGGGQSSSQDGRSEPRLPIVESGRGLPNIDGNASVFGPNNPVTLRLDPNLKNTLEQNPQPPKGNQPPAKDWGDPPPGEEKGSSNAGPQEAPGIMEIKVVGRGSKPAGDSGDPSMHPNGVEALLRTARSQYQIGNYTAAATSYERALRAGADPASGNQRLAQCYEKLGRNSEAVSAYNRAIDALQADQTSGRGDKARIGAALDSCKQAVKVLGG